MSTEEVCQPLSQVEGVGLNEEVCRASCGWGCELAVKARVLSHQEEAQWAREEVQVIEPGL